MNDRSRCRWWLALGGIVLRGAGFAFRKELCQPEPAARGGRHLLPFLAADPVLHGHRGRRHRRRQPYPVTRFRPAWPPGPAPRRCWPGSCSWPPAVTSRPSTSSERQEAAATAPCSATSRAAPRPPPSWPAHCRWRPCSSCRTPIRSRFTTGPHQRPCPAVRGRGRCLRACGLRPACRRPAEGHPPRRRRARRRRCRLGLGRCPVPDAPARHLGDPEQRRRTRTRR